MDRLEHLKLHLSGKVIILGIGNTLQKDDGVGSILAAHLKDKLPYLVYDSGSSPENYLGKIIKDKPDTIVIVDAVDFGAAPGDFSIFEGSDIKSVNFFSTHDSSISLAIHYLQSNLAVDIIILAIQPKLVAFGEGLSKEVDKTLNYLEEWLLETGKKKR